MRPDSVLARPFAAILFDLDGTLIDSTGSVERCWRRWADEFRVELCAPHEHGLPARTMVARHLQADRVDHGVSRIEELEIADTDGITLLPGVERILLALADGRVAIVTSCTAPLAAARMTAAGLAAPPVVVTVDQLARGKPDPEGYLRAASLLDVDPRRCLVVEDAPGGLAAGAAAGCATVGLTTTTARDRLDADLVIDTLADLRVADSADGIRVRLT